MYKYSCYTGSVISAYTVVKVYSFVFGGCDEEKYVGYESFYQSYILYYENSAYYVNFRVIP